MPKPILYLAITNHGFGHATRAASIAADIQKLCPEILLILATTAPRSLLEAYLPGDFIHRPRAFDVGVVQVDSVMMDLPTTLEKLQHLRAHQQAIIASEATFINQNQVGLVLADIPPLAAPIAKAAGVPAWMMGNFGWDFIYRPWGGEFLGIADWITDCFQQCDRLFRMPFHEPMTAFSNITDVGLTGVNPRFPEAEMRQRFGLENTPKAKTVLVTFGGLGLNQVPFQNFDRFPDWQFIGFDLKCPDFPNLLKITDFMYRPVDFMPLCGRILSKPGYSTFSEACRLEVPIITIPRAGFAETAVLLNGLQDYAHHRILTHEEFFTGDWTFLAEPMQAPRLSTRLAKDGNQTIAQAVVDYLQP